MCYILHIYSIVYTIHTIYSHIINCRIYYFLKTHFYVNKGKHKGKKLNEQKYSTGEKETASRMCK